MSTQYTEIGQSIYDSLVKNSDKWYIDNRYNLLVNDELDVKITPWGSDWKGIKYSQDRELISYYPEYINREDCKRIVETASKLLSNRDKAEKEKKKQKILDKHGVKRTSTAFDETVIFLAVAVLNGDKTAAKALVDSCLEQL